MTARNRILKACRWVTIITGMLLACAGTGNTLRAASVPPVILKVSDAVAPGRSFSINGEWFDPATVKVALAPDTTGQSPAAPPANAIYPAILQTDKGGHFVVARLPAASSPGAYDVWVSNSVGWSACAKMNEARALYMSEREAYSNINIEVVGRNFQQSEFGGSKTTRARLNTSSKTYPLTVKDLNPYHLTFTISNQPVATYFVEVSSDSGTNWSRLSSGQTLAIMAAPSTNSDPLGLGVSWAKDFNWTNVYNVTNYNVVPNITNDQYSAIQAVMNNAESHGGGIVYFPTGYYYASGFQIGTDVVVEGQDEYNTKIYYTGAGGGCFIKSFGTLSLGGIPQLQGIANLSILVPSTNKPDVFLGFGDTSGIIGYDESIRTGNRMFVKGVNLNYSCDPADTDTHQGIGFQCGGSERFIFENNTFVGLAAGINAAYVTQYGINKNNHFEYSAGYVEASPNYYFCESNHLKSHYEYAAGNHGLDGRNDYYVMGNYMEGIGATTSALNEGEAIFVENPNGYFNYGSVISATINTITVSTITNLTVPTLQYGNLSVLIVYGTGMGQMLPVASIDTDTDIITLSRSFSVTPDATSKFTLYAPNSGYTVYSNTVVNCANAILLYDGGYDTVIANNILIDDAGIFIHSAHEPSQIRDDSCYFQRVIRNTLIGFSRRALENAIGVATTRSGSFFGVQQYSTEIVNNYVSANNIVSGGSGNGGIPHFDGIYINGYDIFNSMIESNIVSNLYYGVQISDNNYGQYVNTNRYDTSVFVFSNNFSLSSENVIITNNVKTTSTTLPVITAQPRSQTVYAKGIATFYVLATGTPAPYYYWFKNGVPIGGTNSASYAIPFVAAGDNDSQFSVIVSNSAGSVVSGNALLTVSGATVTSNPPSQLRVISGGAP